MKHPMALSLLVIAAAAAMVGAVRAARAPAMTPASELIADANLAFREHRYAAAYGRYTRLADGGDLPSAQAALFMLRNGPALFGSEWSASASQQLRWQALVVNGARAHIELVPNPAGD